MLCGIVQNDQKNGIQIENVVQETQKISEMVKLFLAKSGRSNVKRDEKRSKNYENEKKNQEGKTAARKGKMDNLVRNLRIGDTRQKLICTIFNFVNLQRLAIIVSRCRGKRDLCRIKWKERGWVRDRKGPNRGAERGRRGKMGRKKCCAKGEIVLK